MRMERMIRPLRPRLLRIVSLISCRTSQGREPGRGFRTSVSRRLRAGEVEEQLLQGQLVRSGPLAKLLQCALGEQAAMMDDPDAVGEPLRNVQYVGGDDHARAGADLRLEHVLDLPR